MGEIMKKTSFIILVLLLLCTIMPAFAQDVPVVYTSGNWEYQAGKTGWTITDYRGEETEIEIPSEFEGTPVTSLGPSLFINSIRLERVIIPDSVTAIGKAAFQGCSALKDVTLSFTLKALPEAAFKYCTALETVTLPSTLTSIGKEAFADCVRLNEIIIPSAVTTIGESAFDNCQSLTDVYISRRVAGIGGHAFRGTPWFDALNDEFVVVGSQVLIKYNGSRHRVEIPYGTISISGAFEGNVSVESVQIPESVTAIGQYAFKDCVNLSSINIPNGVKSISAGAFQNCRRITALTLPESVTTIGADAFNGCEWLTQMIFPSQIKQLPARVLRGCPALIDVHIPEAVTKIDKTAFTGSENANIQVAPGSKAEELLTALNVPYSYYLMQKDGFIYSRDSESVQIVKYVGALYDVEVPAVIDDLPVTGIETAAFQNNPNVRRVILPLTVKSIGEWAFSYMDSLETVQMTIGLSSLGANAFTGSNALWEIIIPKSVKEIGENAFDQGNGMMICAAEESKAAVLLTDMGYKVSPENACKSDAEVLDRWAEANLNVGSVCDYGPASQTAGSYVPTDVAEVDLVRVPDGMTVIDEDLLINAGTDLVLVVPSSVKEIDEVILSGRNLTLVGDAGSAAESFAREHDVKFIVRVDTWLGY